MYKDDIGFYINLFYALKKIEILAVHCVVNC